MAAQTLLQTNGSGLVKHRVRSYKTLS